MSFPCGNACENPLVDDADFQKALNFATQERSEQLQLIQSKQSDAFLKKCMEKYHVQHEIELARHSLTDDPLFRKAQHVASPEQKKKLDLILMRQKELLEEKKKLHYGIAAFIVGLLFIIILVASC